MTPDPTPVPAAPTPRTPAQKAAIWGGNAVEQYPDEHLAPALTEPTANVPPGDTGTADVERIMRRIAVRRVILGLTKHEAAALLGMNPWQVGIWETGRQVPSATNLARYARLVGLRLVTVEPDVEQTAMAVLTPDDPSLPGEGGE